MSMMRNDSASARRSPVRHITTMRARFRLPTHVSPLASSKRRTSSVVYDSAGYLGTTHLLPVKLLMPLPSWHLGISRAEVVRNEHRVVKRSIQPVVQDFPRAAITVAERMDP